MPVSVAMAAYNGEKYISEQIDSILSQLGSADELIISLNPSSDNTEDIIKKYVKNDNRVRVFPCIRKGVINNFENAIRQCSHEIIFLSDQDDIWLSGKIQSILPYFQNNDVLAVAHMPRVVDAFLRPISVDHKNVKEVRTVRPLEIIYKNCIQGSCLAFRNEILKYALPFPKNLPMHDSWLGIVGGCMGRTLLISEELILYRQHDSNVTSRKHQKLIKMFKDRFALLQAYVGLNTKLPC